MNKNELKKKLELNIKIMSSFESLNDLLIDLNQKLEETKDNYFIGNRKKHKLFRINFSAIIELIQNKESGILTLLKEDFSFLNKLVNENLSDEEFNLTLESFNRFRNSKLIPVIGRFIYRLKNDFKTNLNLYQKEISKSNVAKNSAELDMFNSDFKNESNISSNKSENDQELITRLDQIIKLLKQKLETENPKKEDVEKEVKEVLLLEHMAESKKFFDSTLNNVENLTISESTKKILKNFLKVKKLPNNFKKIALIFSGFPNYEKLIQILSKNETQLTSLEYDILKLKFNFNKKLHIIIENKLNGFKQQYRNNKNQLIIVLANYKKILTIINTRFLVNLNIFENRTIGFLKLLNLIFSEISFKNIVDDSKLSEIINKNFIKITLQYEFQDINSIETLKNFFEKYILRLNNEEFNDILNLFENDDEKAFLSKIYSDKQILLSIIFNQNVPKKTKYIISWEIKRKNKEYSNYFKNEFSNYGDIIKDLNIIEKLIFNLSLNFIKSQYILYYEKRGYSVKKISSDVWNSLSIIVKTVLAKYKNIDFNLFNLELSQNIKEDLIKECERYFLKNKIVNELNEKVS